MIYINIFYYGEFMQNVILYVENFVWGVPLISLLMFTHIFFTFKLKLPQLNIVKGLKYIILGNKENTDEGISSFKSLMAVLAGTLGTGNIIGVATAIIIGGAGSIFWMFLSGVFAIATKYAETYIVLKYRKIKKNKYYGGAMYVIEERLGNKKLACIFGILVIISTFGMGALIQSNAISTAILTNFNIDLKSIGIIIVILSALVLFGNEKRISNVSSFLIPIAVILYIICSVILLIMFGNNIVPSIKYIISEAFNFKSLTGGILSSTAILAMSSGMSKGLFTNEAGMGTSPLFDVSVNEKDIKKQSIISSTTVFIDTVVLCTITGIIFVSSGMYTYISNPSILAQEVFSILPFGKYMFMFFICIFAISTIPCSGYYGSVAIKYLFKDKKIYEFMYKIIYLTFVFIGSISQIFTVWSISSIANALMILPNIYMLFYLSNEIE